MTSHFKMVFSILIPLFRQHVLCGLLLLFSSRTPMDAGMQWARREVAVVGIALAELL